ncbi:MAG TPA: hypothetical protein VN722_11770 [Hanamia sp.]|nr:hypothetical protein [Hanamia sp.]
MKQIISYMLLLLVAILFDNCTKDNLNNNVKTPAITSNATIKNDAGNSNFVSNYHGLGKQTLWELQQARSASARYRDIKNAIKDGYADINVVMPNMGYHYMKSSLADTIFDPGNPELLVYNKNEEGNFELLAVEYAVPIALSPNAAPSGFTGSNDVWDHNTMFGLWLLHAWVWNYNSDGVFNPTNPLVVVR